MVRIRKAPPSRRIRNTRRRGRPAGRYCKIMLRPRMAAHCASHWRPHASGHWLRSSSRLIPLFIDGAIEPDDDFRLMSSRREMVSSEPNSKSRAAPKGIVGDQVISARTDFDRRPGRPETGHHRIIQRRAVFVLPVPANISCDRATIVHDGCCIDDPQGQRDLVHRSSTNDEISRSFCDFRCLGYFGGGPAVVCSKSRSR